MIFCCHFQDTIYQHDFSHVDKGRCLRVDNGVFYAFITSGVRGFGKLGQHNKIHIIPNKNLPNTLLAYVAKKPPRAIISQFRNLLTIN